MIRIQCRSWDEAETHHIAHYSREDQLAIRLRKVEKQLDTLGTTWWKRLIFRIDGWPAWYIVAEKPKWRPWRKWWTS